MTQIHPAALFVIAVIGFVVAMVALWIEGTPRK